MDARMTLVDKRGKEHIIRLNTENSVLYWEDTETRVALDPVQLEYVSPNAPWEHVVERSISPENPGSKEGAKSLVKIQLGLACNFSCSYCSQSDQDAPKPEDKKGKRFIPIIPKSNARQDDVARFLDNLQNWLIPGEDLRFELWGGEPFIYWKTFRPLAEGLMERYPAARVSTVTNGSLLTNEIVDWILAHPAVSLAISHDGPNSVRDEDVLNRPEVVRLYHEMRKQGRGVGFNCVLFAGSLSVVAIRKHIADKLGVPEEEVHLSTEGLVTPHDEASQKFMPSHEQLGELFREMVSKKSMFIFYQELQSFIQSIAHGQLSRTLGQKCGMDRQDSIAVSLKTQDVLTCQNTLPLGRHRLGHVDDLANTKLTSSWHWQSREKCASCPVLTLCQGSCMYLEAADFERACESQFKYRLPFLAAALYFITGFVMTKVEWIGGVVEVDYLGLKKGA